MVDDKNKLMLFSNAPEINEKDYSKYSEILHAKIRDESVKNIGIIAPYGAGKSSLIETYIF